MAAGARVVAGRAGWLLLLLLATLNGLLALRYTLPHILFPSNLPNFLNRRDWLVAHAAFGGVALLVGPWQFSGWLRRRSLALHRWMGRIYCIAVALSWGASLPIAPHAFTGIWASLGFLLLGAVWISTTAMGYFTIRAGHVEAHRAWMIRSYAMAAAAITLRIYLPLWIVMDGRISVGYPLIAWACWVPNLIFAEWLVRRRRRALAAVPAPA
jgi:uncharacterized membrane protein